MNPFEQHGLQHLSVSQLNLWANAPGVYVMERLLKRSAPVGAAAHRGTAVEAGVEHGLMTGEDLQACIDVANATFTERTALNTDPRKEKERAAIPGMVEAALDTLLPWGRPTHCQVKVEWPIDGIEVPVIGYLDFQYDQHGLILDLKTAHTISNTIKTPHARQVASYIGRGSNIRGGLVYCTPKKAHVLQLENPDEHIKALESIARSLRAFLSLSSDAEELAALLSVDTDSFYLAHPTARQNAFAVFGV